MKLNDVGAALSTPGAPGGNELATVTLIAALCLLASLTVMVHVPAAFGVTCKIEDGPVAFAEETLAMPAHVSLSVKAPEYDGSVMPML